MIVLEIIMWIREFWHKLRKKESFRVIYKDGNRSTRMTYSCAYDYACIFYGIVVFDPKE